MLTGLQSITRLAELAEPFAIRRSASGGFTSGKLEAVYLSAQRARAGAVQCIGKGCDAWYVPPVPHAPRGQQAGGYGSHSRRG